MLTIGIHTGKCPEMKMNYGTLITPEIRDWIEE